MFPPQINGTCRGDIQVNFEEVCYHCNTRSTTTIAGPETSSSYSRTSTIVSVPVSASTINSTPGSSGTPHISTQPRTTQSSQQTTSGTISTTPSPDNTTTLVVILVVAAIVLLILIIILCILIARVIKTCRKSSDESKQNSDQFQEDRGIEPGLKNKPETQFDQQIHVYGNRAFHEQDVVNRVEIPAVAIIRPISEQAGYANIDQLKSNPSTSIAHHEEPIGTNPFVISDKPEISVKPKLSNVKSDQHLITPTILTDEELGQLYATSNKKRPSEPHKLESETEQSGIVENNQGIAEVYAKPNKLSRKRSVHFHEEKDTVVPPVEQYESLVNEDEQSQRYGVNVEQDLSLNTKPDEPSKYDKIQLNVSKSIGKTSIDPAYDSIKSIKVDDKQPGNQMISGRCFDRVEVDFEQVRYECTKQQVTPSSPSPTSIVALVVLVVASFVLNILIIIILCIFIACVIRIYRKSSDESKQQSDQFKSDCHDSTKIDRDSEPGLSVKPETRHEQHEFPAVPIISSISRHIQKENDNVVPTEGHYESINEDEQSLKA
ncbi:unnamed protein product [Owenia fusiformis]|uniref:Uncharacterized protein n=1 Tax=Owenia fusiformis TaxID=6347 RepID=A0A8S4Q762_OWEFU|nr:unnamed protein product [Owenia fusiformis]